MDTQPTQPQTPPVQPAQPMPAAPAALGYGFDESNAVESQYLPVGILENILCTGVEFGPSKDDGTGTNVIKFHFSRENLGAFTHMEFPIDADAQRTWAAQKGRDPEAAVKKEYAQQGNRIRHILSSFVPAESLNFKANSWQEYGTGVATLAAPYFANAVLRLKLVYNTKDYVSFPRNSISPFCEPMTVSPTKMIINPRWDRVILKPAAPAPGTGGAAGDAFAAPSDTPQPGGLVF